MIFTIVKIDALSGAEAGVYSVRIEPSQLTLFELFLQENKETYRAEVKDILSRLKEIGHNTGARETFFRPREGKLGSGDGIEALSVEEGKLLRLYCIRNGRVAVVVGGGGPKYTRTWQEDPKLKDENEMLQTISQTIIKAIVAKDIYWLHGGQTLDGDLTLDTDNY